MLHKPTLYYDGSCNFCVKCTEHWQKVLGDKVNFADLYESAGECGISMKEAIKKVHFTDAKGKTYSGAEAVFRMLSLKARYKPLLFLYKYLPGFAPIAEWAYVQVADRRK